MKETNPTGSYPKWADRLYLNYSRRPTSYRSGVVDPTLESCDPLLQVKPTLPSLGQPTVKGAALEVDQTFDFSPYISFIQGARQLARLGFVFIGTPHKALLLLSSVAFTPSTFLNSFPSYSSLRPASQEENPKKLL